MSEHKMEFLSREDWVEYKGFRWKRREGGHGEVTWKYVPRHGESFYIRGTVAREDLEQAYQQQIKDAEVAR